MFRAVAGWLLRSKKYRVAKEECAGIMLLRLGRRKWTVSVKEKFLPYHYMVLPGWIS